MAERILTGIKPTGQLTLGNYIGVLRNLKNQMDRGECFIFIADLHALTLPIEPEVLRDISNIIGYIDVASNLVRYDTKYYNIVMNQLGNIIVTSDINSAIAISKKINHRYRVISLDGEIVHVGGVMTGGSFKSNNSYISDKYEEPFFFSLTNPSTGEFTL